MNLVRRVENLELLRARPVPATPPVPFERPADVLAVLAEAVNAVRSDPHADPAERALTLLLEALARGDEAEADRLHASCPRKTYTQQDAAFNGRLSLAFETMALVCIDLRCMWGKLQMLQWSLLVTEHFALERQLNASFAFLDGGRCAEGLPQLDWFANAPPSAGAELGEEDEPGGDDEQDDHNDAPATCPRFVREANEHGRRLSAVEDRAERSTAEMWATISQVAIAVANDLVNAWAAFDRFCRTKLGVSANVMLAAWRFPLAEFRSTLKLYKSVVPDEEKVEELLGGMTANWDGRYGKEANDGR
jgi:hypothetical protein